MATTPTMNYQSSTSTIPGWLESATRNLVGQGQTAANTAYQPYAPPKNVGTYGVGSRIAGFNPTQQSAFQQIQANQGTWKPFTDEAQQNVHQVVGDYMNPYTQQVVDNVATLGQRNLTENLLPQVNSTFTGAGQFGSSRNADFTNRALRDTNESVMRQQGELMRSGYGDASQLALQDLQRIGGLGQVVSQLGYTDAMMQSGVGQQQQDQTQKSLDMAYGDFTGQRDYQQNQLNWLSSLLRGMPAPTSTSTTQSTNPYAGTGGISPLMSAWQGASGAYSALS